MKSVWKDEAGEKRSGGQNGERDEHRERRFMRIELMAVMSMRVRAMAVIRCAWRGGGMAMAGRGVAVVGPMRSAEEGHEHQPPGIE